MTARSKLAYAYIFFVIAYAAFVLIPAPARTTLLQYGVSTLGLRLIYLTISVLLAGIWFAGFYGYSKLHAYSQVIKGGKDGQHVATLCKGLLIVVMWLPVSSLSSVIFSYISSKHVGFLSTSTIVNNYINLLLPLGGFMFIGIGAHGLNKLTKRKTSLKITNLFALLLIYIGLIYLRLLASTPNRTAVYHLSIWVLLITVAAPYVYMWFIGLVATYEIYNYQKKVAGIMYRKSWKFLSLGLGWLIVTSIIFQYLTTLSSRLDKLSIYWILAIIYSLLLLLSLGFVFIAIGTRKLQRLEEV